VEVLAAVAPTADVNAADLADASHRTLDPGDEEAELGGQVVGEVAGIGVVIPRLEQDHDRQPVGLGGEQTPALVRPEVRLVGLGAAPAIDAALAIAGLLVGEWRQERSRSHVPVERELLPLLDGGHPEMIDGASVDLLRRLRHRGILRRR
jgi:hypothetical protein